MQSLRLYLSKLLGYIVDHSIAPNAGPELRMRLRLLNGINATLFFTHIGFLVAILASGWHEILWLNLIADAGFLILFFLPKVTPPQWSAAASYLFTSTYFFTVFLYIGRDGGMQYALLLCAVLPALVFRKLLTILLFSVFGIALLGFGFLWLEKYGPVIAFSHPGFYIAVAVATFAGLLVFVLYYRDAFEKYLRISSKQQKMLEARNADLDLFLHLMAHDLKTPVQGIHKLVDLLDEEASIQGPAWKLAATRIRAKTRMMHDILSSMVEYHSALDNRSDVASCDPEQAYRWLQSTLLQPAVLAFHWQNSVPSIPMRPRAFELLLFNFLKHILQEQPQSWVEIHADSKLVGGVYEIEFSESSTPSPAEWQPLTYNVRGFIPSALAMADKITRDHQGCIWQDLKNPKHFRLHLMAV